MEEKIVGEKKGSSLFSDISFTLLSIASLTCLHLRCACARPTTPLWFTDNTGSCVRLNEQYSTDQSDPNGRHQWNGKVGDRRRNENSPPQTRAHQDHCGRKHPSYEQRLSCLAGWTLPPSWNATRDARVRAISQQPEQRMSSMSKRNSGRRTIDLSFPHTSGNIWRISCLPEMNWKLRSLNRKLWTKHFAQPLSSRPRTLLRTFSPFELYPLPRTFLLPQNSLSPRAIPHLLLQNSLLPRTNPHLL